MTIADLEREAALADEGLTEAEAEANSLRCRFDAALAEWAPQTRALRDDLSRALLVSELRAAQARKRANVAREALELTQIATAGRSRRAA